MSVSFILVEVINLSIVHSSQININFKTLFGPNQPFFINISLHLHSSSKSSRFISCNCIFQKASTGHPYNFSYPSQCTHYKKELKPKVQSMSKDVKILCILAELRLPSIRYRIYDLRCNLERYESNLKWEQRGYCRLSSSLVQCLCDFNSTLGMQMRSKAIYCEVVVSN